jgi:hypothetical protein
VTGRSNCEGALRPVTTHLPTIKEGPGRGEGRCHPGARPHASSERQDPQ